MSPKINISLTVLYAICACLSLFLSYETHVMDQGILPILFGILSGVIASAVIYLIASTPGEPDRYPVLDDNVEVVTTIYPWGHELVNPPMPNTSWDSIVDYIDVNVKCGVIVNVEFTPKEK
jgi:hypothetical protein